MGLVTFTTEESTEESKKSTEESKNGWRNNGGREEARTLLQRASKCAELGLREEGDGRDIKGGTFSPDWWLQPGLKVTFQPRAQPRPGGRPLLPVGSTNRE